MTTTQVAKLKFYFQPSFSGWTPTSIYEKIFSYYKSIYGDKIISDNTTIQYNSNYGHKSGPHHLIIENTETGYYKVATYWDYAPDLLNDYGGWDNSKCLGVYSCVGANTNTKVIASSYCVHNREIETLISHSNTSFTNKLYNDLIFRGFLYTSRSALHSVIDHVPNNNIKISANKISHHEYVQELASHKIGLSLNGAAEICNRDMEILGVGSVLLRPKLVSTRFHNPLVADFHYVSFETSNDPKTQLDIIAEKHKMLLKDTDYMIYVATNGRDWYNLNGSCEGNTQVLCNILNIEELL
jgi:hypothetical protein